MNEEGIGLYRDYGLEVFRNTPMPEIERKNKQLNYSKIVDYLSPFSVQLEIGELFVLLFTYLIIYRSHIENL